MTSILCPHCRGTVEIPGPQRQPLTKRQAELLTYIRQYNAEHNYSPTYEEMMAHMDCAAGSVVGLVKELRQRGWVRTARLKARSIQIIESDAA